MLTIWVPSKPGKNILLLFCGSCRLVPTGARVPGLVLSHFGVFHLVGEFVLLVVLFKAHAGGVSR